METVVCPTRVIAGDCTARCSGISVRSLCSTRASRSGADRWSTMRLVQDHTAAAQARRYTRQWSSDHGLPERAVDDLELVVDELVTNAVRYASPPYDIDLRCVNGVVRGEVHDGSLDQPSQNTKPDYR